MLAFYQNPQIPIVCNCHGHTDECEYNAEVNERKVSLDINGKYRGGGVCQNCKHNTRGINCEQCMPFFYRPNGVNLTDPNVCQHMWFSNFNLKNI